MQSFSIPVAIVDDDPAIADSIKELLELAGYNVVTFSSGTQFLESDIRNFDGCVLLDVRMPGKDGLTVLAEAIQINPNLHVVMISGHGDIPMAVKALKLGALDFIEKPFVGPVILGAIENVKNILHAVSLENKLSAEAKSLVAQLTPRETEIIEKLVEGKANKIVAFELGISIRTVETHRARILAKTQVRSLAELVKLYMAATH